MSTAEAPQAAPLPLPEKNPEADKTALSIEEKLMNKIREKIDSAPAIVEEPILEEPIAQSAAPKQSSLILSKAKWEAIASESPIQATPPSQSSESPSIAAVVEQPAAAPFIAPESAPLPPSDAASLSRYDTLMRFAAVELEGIIKKEQPNG